MVGLRFGTFHKHVGRGLRSAFIIATLLLGSSAVFGQDFTDASGQVIVRVYTGPWVYGQHNQTSVSVDSDFVLVGGGAMVSRSQSDNLGDLLGEPGALLTASYPDANLATWHAKSKDHATAYSHYLRAFAIGLRLSGISSVQLRSYMRIVSGRTGTAVHNPNAVASLPPGYLLVGGGARANGTLQKGLLLTASHPVNTFQWTASAKDHHFSELGTVDAFAIGIQQSIPGFGLLNAFWNSDNAYVPTSYGVASVPAPSGWVLTSVGGWAEYSGSGRLLTALFPFGDASSNRLGAMAISKDHLGPYTTAGLTHAYAISIQKQ